MVDHFVKEEIARRTVYNALNRRKNSQSTLFDTRLDPFLSWTSSMRGKLKRQANNRNGVSQSKLNKKFHKNQTTISRQIQKLAINN